MKLEKAELFTGLDDPWTVIVVTTNSTLRKDGSLVMGRGAALQAKQLWPELPARCGDKIRRFGKDYGFLIVLPPGRCYVGIFQVKHHWKDSAELGIIRNSVQVLQEAAMLHPKHTFRMNFPGIGNGRLKYTDVLPLLKDLPDNVVIVTKEAK